METTPLVQMKGPERAALLAALFPDEITSLIRFIEGMCMNMIEDQQQARSLAEKNFISYQRWMQAVRKSKELIDAHVHTSRHGELLVKMMTGEDLEYFNMLCIVLKITTQAAQSHDEQSFYHALHMLYD